MSRDIQEIQAHSLKDLSHAYHRGLFPDAETRGTVGRVRECFFLTTPVKEEQRQQSV
jgi:hypothetical protein